MTFKVKPSVNSEMVPSDVAAALDLMLPDCVLGTALALSEVAGPSLNLQIGTGKCFVDGYYVEITVAEVKALTAGSTNHVYIQLVRNGNNEVTGAQITSNTTGVDPADSMKIAVVTTVGSDITAISSTQTLRDNDSIVYLPKLAGTPTDAQNFGAKMYNVTVDANNQKIALNSWANGAMREIILWG